MGYTFTLMLDDAQSASLAEWLDRIARANGDEGLEPPGYDLVITEGEPYGCSAIARCGTSTLDLGDVEWTRVET